MTIKTCFWILYQNSVTWHYNNNIFNMVTLTITKHIFTVIIRQCTHLLFIGLVFSSQFLSKTVDLSSMELNLSFTKVVGSIILDFISVIWPDNPLNADGCFLWSVCRLPEMGRSCPGSGVVGELKDRCSSAIVYHQAACVVHVRNTRTLCTMSGWNDNILTKFSWLDW